MMREIGRGAGEFSVSEESYDQNRYYEGRCAGKVYAYTHLQFTHEICYIHLYVQRWSKEIYREMKKDLEILKEYLRGWGIKELIGSHPVEGGDKWCRFLKSIGFTDVFDWQTLDGKALKFTRMEV